MSRKGENIYKRKDGRYEGRYVKERRSDGSLRYGFVYGYSYDEAREKLLAAKDTFHSAPDTSLSVSAYMTKWLEETAHKRVKPSTYSRYRDRVHSYIIPMLGTLALKSLSKSDIQSFISGLGERNLSRSTVEGIFTTLRSALKDATAAGIIEGDLCVGAVLPKAEVSVKARILTRHEQLRLVMAAEHTGQSVELSVLLSLYAGLSTGEICALRWRDVDFVSGTLMAGGILERVKVYEDGEAKTVLMESQQKGWRSQRRIPLPEGLRTKLRKYGEGMPGSFFVLSGSTNP